MPQEKYGSDAYSRHEANGAGQGPAMSGACGGGSSQNLSIEKSEMPCNGGGAPHPEEGPTEESPED